MSGLLPSFLHWRPERDRVLEKMRPPSCRRIRLGRFPRGIDNIRIDVALDRELVNAAAAAVKVVLLEDVQRHFWKQPLKAPDVQSIDVFRDAYVKTSRVVIDQARAAASPQRVQLYQIAVFRLLLELVDRALLALREELSNASAHPSRRESGQSLELHERIVALTRYAREIRYRAASDILREAMRLEDSTLRRTRKSILGVSWPTGRQMLDNPVLALGGRGSADDFAAHFPLVLYQDARARQLVSCIYSVCDDWLPDGVGVPQTAGRGAAVDRSRGGQGGVPGSAETEQSVLALIAEEERERFVPHAFDNAPAVADLLGGLDPEWPNPGPWEERRMGREQKRRVKALRSCLRRAGLLADVRASYLLQGLYPSLGLRGASELVYEYLCGRLARRELAKRLNALPGVGNAAELIKRIDGYVKQKSVRDSRGGLRLLVQCAHDSVQYRYQLKLAWWMFARMDEVRLLFDEREIEMSRANGLLQEFSESAQGLAAGECAVGHVVIKADVRGSSRMTAKMRERNLNPAAYFSRNLYDPINALLKDFGAEKVFVEGDAVILAILQHASGDRLAVARACGLAQRILGVVDRKNAESQRLGLPLLELGIGIAYSEELPTYLYDEGRKIMISPAINRADRLSSCGEGLREVFEQQGEARRGVEVVVPLRDERDRGGNGEALERYNVNGIELDYAAFVQLGQELNLRRLELDGERGYFHVGRYPDLHGNAHLLVVRDAPVRSWVGNRLLEEVGGGRRFHEVVTDAKLRALIQGLAAKRG